MIKNKLEKFLVFCDKHHKETIYITLFLSIISAILYILGHTSKYGYNASMSDNIYFALPELLAILLLLDFYKIENVEKRLITFMYLLVFCNSIAQVLGSLYCILIHDITPLELTILYTPLFIALFSLIYYARSIFSKAFKILSINIKTIIKMFFKIF